MTDYERDQVHIDKAIVLNSIEKQRMFRFEVIVPEAMVHKALIRQGINHSDLRNYFDSPEKVERETFEAIDTKLAGFKKDVTNAVGNRFRQMLDVDTQTDSPVLYTNYTGHSEGGFTRDTVKRTQLHQLAIPISITNQNGPMGIVEQLEQVFHDSGKKVGYCDNLKRSTETVKAGEFESTDKMRENFQEAVEQALGISGVAVARKAEGVALTSR